MCEIDAIAYYLPFVDKISMNAANVELAKLLVRASYVSQGSQGIAAREKLLTTLLSERRLPARGWDEAQLELLVRDAALMDSNNFLANVGVGEREARVACPLVRRRHFGLAHGIGRSGDITAEQPKAAGSTLLARLCNLLAADALRVAGLTDLSASTVLPLATGMSLTVVLLALARQRPGARSACRSLFWSPLTYGGTDSSSGHAATRRPASRRCWRLACSWSLCPTCWRATRCARTWAQYSALLKQSALPALYVSCPPPAASRHAQQTAC